MTDLFVPDVSVFNHAVSLKGAHYVIARATEGDWLTDADYHGYVSQATQLGTGLAAYHFLEDGSSAQAQAKYAFGVVGKRPLMLDLEPIPARTGAAPAIAAADPGGPGRYCGQALKDLRTQAMPPGWTSHPPESASMSPAAAAYISKPGIPLAAAFIDAYRALGGVCYDLYFPHWYWTVLGSPSLKPFTGRHMLLHSSQYTIYSDTGPGWQPYGGMTPTFWQYADNVNFNGVPTDFSAYRAHATTAGGAVKEVSSLMATGKLPAAAPTRHTADGTASLAQVCERAGKPLWEAVWLTMTHHGTAAQVGPLQRRYFSGGRLDRVMPEGMLYWLP